MKKRFLKFITIRRSGFTIVESLVSLIMVAMAVFLIATFSGLVLHDVHHHDETVNFYMYLNELENHDYQVIKCEPDQVLLANQQNHRKYRVKQFNNLVIMTGLRDGYVPLLKNVQSADWHYHDNVLSSHLVMADQQKFSAKSWFKKCTKKVR